MRFVVMVKATAESEAGVMPSEKLLAAMNKFNEELVNAGVMLAGEGLHPSSRGARVKFNGDQRRVVDGPFAETKELIGGYWMLQAKSIDEVVEWMKRFPLDKNGGELEIRRLIDVGDFAMSEEANAMHERLEKQVRR